MITRFARSTKPRRWFYSSVHIPREISGRTRPVRKAKLDAFSRAGKSRLTTSFRSFNASSTELKKALGAGFSPERRFRGSLDPRSARIRRGSSTIYASNPASSAAIVPVSDSRGLPFHWLLIGLSFCAIVYIASTYFAISKDAYRRRFDPTLALKYVKIFFDDIIDERMAATKQAIKFVEQPESIKTRAASQVDDVLDVLDDIGFLVRGSQISEYVVHHYFFHWIQIYYESCASYIKHCQRQEGARWEDIEDLYDDLVIIEAYKSKVNKQNVELEKVELIKRLEDEFRSPSPTLNKEALQH